MRKTIFSMLMVLLPLITFSQEVELKSGHIIKVEDEEIENFLETYIEKLGEYPIEFEYALEKIDSITEGIDKDRQRVAKNQGNVIYLNPRLDDFPYTKKAIILHYILKNNGVESRDTSYPHVMNNSIDMDKRTESSFRMQFRDNAIYGWVIRELKEVSPLESTL